MTDLTWVGFLSAVPGCWTLGFSAFSPVSEGLMDLCCEIGVLFAVSLGFPSKVCLPFLPNTMAQSFLCRGVLRELVCQ